MVLESGRYVIGEIDVIGLAKEFGTPLFVYDEAIIRDRIKSLRDGIPYPRLDIHYACKANSNPYIMKILLEEGAKIDAVSPGEIFLALKVGYGPKDIIFTGNSVSNDEIRFCLENDILVNIDSLSQLESYGKLAPGSSIAIRLNPDIGAGHHNHCITGGPQSKFGIYITKTAAIKEIAAKYNLKIIGIHSHIGSGILDEDTFLEVMDIILDEARYFDDIEFIDFGGGIGVPYRPDEKPINIKELGNKMADRFNSFCKDYGKELAMKLEPGRYLVAESGILLTKVNRIKNDKYRFVGCDSGFNLLARPFIYGSYHEIVNVSNPSGEGESVVITGNLCESGDVFTRDEYGIKPRNISKVREGDILAIMNAGAYGFSMSSNYNMRPRAAEVVVKGNKVVLTRRAESFDDILKNVVWW